MHVCTYGYQLCNCANYAHVWKSSHISVIPVDSENIIVTSAKTMLLITQNIIPLQGHNILCNQQHGFRTGHSCETQLISTVYDLACNLNSGLQTELLLLDFKKAFDKVPHYRLYYKLSHYGIRGTTLS